MTSTGFATTNCGSDNDDVLAMQQNLSHRQCRRSRSAKAKMKTIQTMQFNQIVLNIAVYMFAAIVLLNTVGLNSVVRADTVQYPVTAPFGSGLIPPGKRLLIIIHLNF